MVDITPHAKVQDLIDQGAKASRKYEREGGVKVKFRSLKAERAAQIS